MNSDYYLVPIDMSNFCKQNFGYQANSDYYLVPKDTSNLILKAICLKILIPRDDLQDTYRILTCSFSLYQ